MSSRFVLIYENNCLFFRNRNPVRRIRCYQTETAALIPGSVGIVHGIFRIIVEILHEIVYNTINNQLRTFTGNHIRTGGILWLK